MKSNLFRLLAKSLVWGFVVVSGVVMLQVNEVKAVTKTGDIPGTALQYTYYYYGATDILTISVKPGATDAESKEIPDDLFSLVTVFKGPSYVIDELHIEPGVKAINSTYYNKVFGGCQIKELDIPSSVTHIGGYAFHQSFVKKLIFHNEGSLNISLKAFEMCTDLQEIYFMGTNTTELIINPDAFYDSHFNGTVYVADASMVDTIIDKLTTGGISFNPDDPCHATIEVLPSKPSDIISEPVAADSDTYKSCLPSKTIMANGVAEGSDMLYEIKAHDMSDSDSANQKILVDTFAKGKKVKIIAEYGICPNRALSSTENGSKKPLTWSDLSCKTPGTIYAACYNQTDKAYVMAGTIDAFGTARFTDYILRPATNITLFTIE